MRDKGEKTVSIVYNALCITICLLCNIYQLAAVDGRGDRVSNVTSPSYYLKK